MAGTISNLKVGDIIIISSDYQNGRYDNKNGEIIKIEDSGAYPYHIRFEDNNLENCYFSSSEISLVGRTTSRRGRPRSPSNIAKDEFKKSIDMMKEMKKVEEERKKQQEKLKKLTKNLHIGAMIKSNRLNRDDNLTGTAIIENKDRGLIKARILDCSRSELNGALVEVEVKDIELIDSNKLVPFGKRKGQLFSPCFVFKPQDLSVAKQLTLIRKLKEIDNVEVVKKDEEWVITTKELITSYPEQCDGDFNLGVYQLKIYLGEENPDYKSGRRVELKARNINGGYYVSDEDAYAMSPFIELVTNKDNLVRFSSICFGNAQNVVEKCALAHDLYGIVKLFLSNMVSDSDNGFTHIGRWVSLLKQESFMEGNKNGKLE